MNVITKLLITLFTLIVLICCSFVFLEIEKPEIFNEKQLGSFFNTNSKSEDLDFSDFQLAENHKKTKNQNINSLLIDTNTSYTESTSTQENKEYPSLITLEKGTTAKILYNTVDDSNLFVMSNSNIVKVDLNKINHEIIINGIEKGACELTIIDNDEKTTIPVNINESNEQQMFVNIPIT